MRIGEYEIKWDGHGYMVGLPPKEGVKKAGMRNTKFYGSIEQALASLPARKGSEIWNTCGDLIEFRDRMRSWVDGVALPIEEALRDAPQRGRRVGAG